MPRAPGWGCCGSSNLSDIGSDCPRYEEGCFSKLQGNCLAIVPKRLTFSVLNCIIVYVEKQWMNIVQNTEILWLSSFLGRFRSVGSLLHNCCSYDLCVEKKSAIVSKKMGFSGNRKWGRLDHCKEMTNMRRNATTIASKSRRIKKAYIYESYVTNLYHVSGHMGSAKSR